MAGKIPAELAVCHYVILRHPEDIGETPEKVPQTSLSIVYISCYISVILFAIVHTLYIPNFSGFGSVSAEILAEM